MSVGNGIGSGIMMTLGADVAPAEGRLPFLSVWRVMSDAGNAAGPVVVSVVATLSSLAAGIVTIGALGPLASVGLTWWVPRYSKFATRRMVRAHRSRSASTVPAQPPVLPQRHSSPPPEGASPAVTSMSRPSAPHGPPRRDRVSPRRARSAASRRQRRLDRPRRRPALVAKPGRRQHTDGGGRVGDLTAEHHPHRIVERDTSDGEIGLFMFAVVAVVRRVRRADRARGTSGSPRWTSRASGGCR